MKCIKLLVIVLFVTTDIFAAKYSMVQVDLGPDARASIERILPLGLDITYYSDKDGMMEAIVNADQQFALLKLGFNSEPVIEDMAVYAENLRNAGYFKHFHTYPQIVAEMQEIVASFPDIAALYDIGDTYNKVHGRGGYDIYALKISDEVANEDETEADVLLMANIHAREIITPEIIWYYMHYLIDNYNLDPYVTHLVNNREIWLITSINPDGHEFVFTGDYGAIHTSYDDPIWWRKNMRDNNNNNMFDIEYDGVDLNRNFGYMWGYDNSGSSSFPSNIVYRGPAPFSEPESQAIRAFVNTHHFIVSLSYHSYSQLWLYPWGYDYVQMSQPDAKSFRDLADSCVAYNGYQAQAGIDLYPVNGDTDDWLYGEQVEKNKVFAFSPEVGGINEGGFFPDTTLIMKLILENLGPNLYMTYAAGEEPIVKHERLPDIENSGAPVILTAQITPPIPLTAIVPLNQTSFKVYYRTSRMAPFDSVMMTSTGNSEMFQAEIPASNLNGMVYYYVSAGDTLGRTGTSPRGAPAALDSFFVEYPVNIVFEGNNLPSYFELNQNYPNPFNSGTRFEYKLGSELKLEIAIYNHLGQTVRTLFQGYQRPGIHAISWDGHDDSGNNCSTGIYIAIFRVDQATFSRKIVYLR